MNETLSRIQQHRREQQRQAEQRFRELTRKLIFDGALPKAAIAEYGEMIAKHSIDPGELDELIEEAKAIPALRETAGKLIERETVWEAARQAASDYRAEMAATIKEMEQHLSELDLASVDAHTPMLEATMARDEVAAFEARIERLIGDESRGEPARLEPDPQSGLIGEIAEV